jgi:hypothetical protein
LSSSNIKSQITSERLPALLSFILGPIQAR